MNWGKSEVGFEFEYRVANEASMREVCVPVGSRNRVGCIRWITVEMRSL